jgi:beta-glucosidase
VGQDASFLDGQLILEQSNSRDLQALSRKISLQQGHAYTLRAEYISTGRGLARIFWALSTGVDPPSLIKAVEAARSSDVAVVFAGAWAHERFDASTLALLPSQNQLIEAVAAVNPRTIVVLQSGTPVLMPWLSKVASVLEAWFPGEEGSTAIADVLSGDVNPSAKLPLTFPTSDDQVPASSANQYPGINSIEHYTEGLNVGYRWQDAQHKTPLFPFGFGLSNTRFKLSHLTYEILADHTSDVSVTAENRGPVPVRSSRNFISPIPPLLANRRFNFGASAKFTCAGKQFKKYISSWRRVIFPSGLLPATAGTLFQGIYFGRRRLFS